MNRKSLALGLMSGTSADGLTVCLFDAASKKVIHFKNYPYEKELQNKILDAVNFKTPRLCALNTELGIMYAKKVKQFFKDFKINPKNITVIGSHGQTIYYNNKKAKFPDTLQIGEAAFIAQETKIPVVYNFRMRDIAAGGRGAPLVPAFDEFLFGKQKPIILLNIGGISNVSISGKGVKTFGFDIGPGNVMIDTAMHYLTKGKANFDKDGKLAAKYLPDVKKAKSMLKDFVKTKPPTALDRNTYLKPFIDKYFKNLEQKDIATITYLTALIITESIKKFILNKHKAGTLAVAGGGVFNKTLMGFISGELKNIKVLKSDQIDPMAKEAAAFAWFALQTMQGRPSNCPRTTGAKENIILGAVILP